MDNQPIGVFDSGIGGLTVVKEILKVLPNESIIYLGDTARVPYGTRSKEVICKFALELTNFLLRKKVKCLVVACNTISATSLEEIKKISPVAVIGVIDPTVRKAVTITKNKKIGIIGTTGTINSKAYENTIYKLDTKIRVVSVACPLLVPIAEEGFSQHEATKMIVKDYLANLRHLSIDTLILGCTHYPLLESVIQEVVGKNVVLIDSAKLTAQALKKLLKEKDLFVKNKKKKLEFFVTDAPERVFDVAGRFFGSELKNKIKKVTL